MLDHDPTHKRELLISSHMPSFFGDLAERYKGKTVYLHSEDPPENAAVSAQPALLTELSFERKHSRDTLTVHMVQAGEGSERTIIASLVWVVRDRDHNLVAVEVIDDQDRTLVLEFGNQPEGQCGSDCLCA